ncbi:MAG: DUF3611 family protein [Kastovskya adunca ATA6-11-RM4]|jgi:hypothetical protein|nr:DUF3611 family protein [Kastovskya adunca ATA6-11-RM4]
METKPDSNSPVAPLLEDIAEKLRLTGWIAFWVQLGLAVASGLSLLYAQIGIGFAAEESPGLGIGIFWAVCGILALAFAVYLAFRYTRIARLLRSPLSQVRPSKAETTKLVRLGLIVGLVGIFLNLLGASFTLSVLVAKTVSQPPGVAITDPYKIVRTLDVFVAVANVNGIGAHFFGTIASLWLFDRVKHH